MRHSCSEMFEVKFHHNEEAGRYKAVSLFSGAGGCSLGFAEYGVDILGAYDIWEEAVNTYNMNFQGCRAHRADLSVCDFSALRDGLALRRGELDILIGGPPCQGFTTAGKRGADDPRNRLLANYLAALSAFEPRWFMMENVEGILTTGKGDFIVECIRRMIEAGYTVCLKKVYMQEYGVPQRRKRVIVVGNREGKDFSFPLPEVKASGSIYRNGAVTLEECIGDLEGRDIPQINHVRKQAEGVRMQRIELLEEGGSMRDLPADLQHRSFRRRATRRVCDGTPSEKRGGAPSGLKRLRYDEPALTVTGAATGEFVHPKENRMLTVRECARIQTFPDDFAFSGSDAQQQKLIGNAVPPLFANRMAEQIVRCDGCESARLPAGLLFYDVTKSSAKSPALEVTCARLDDFLLKTVLK